MKDNTKVPTSIAATTNATDIWNIIFLDKYSTKTAGSDTETQLLLQHWANMVLSLSDVNPGFLSPSGLSLH